MPTSDHLAAFVDAPPDAKRHRPLDGTLTNWNPAAERLYGYAAAEVLGRSVAVFFPPDRKHQLAESLARIRRVAPYQVRAAAQGWSADACGPEVDMPRTQCVKQQMLHDAHIDSTGIAFGCRGLETDDWLARLVDPGFDLTQPAVCLGKGRSISRRSPRHAEALGFHSVWTGDHVVIPEHVESYQAYRASGQWPDQRARHLGGWQFRRSRGLRQRGSRRRRAGRLN